MIDRDICVVMLGAYPTESGHVRGGVQAAYTYLVKGLAQIPGLKLHILTFKPSGYAGPDTLQQGPNLTIHLLQLYPRFERFRNYRNFQKMVDSLLARIQPDLIHVQDIAAEAYVALRSGCPTVMTLHGVRQEDQKHFGSWSRRVRSMFDSALIEKYNLAHAQHLIAVSRYVARYYQPVLQPNVTMHHIPNAVDERFFCTEQAPDSHVILFAGRVTPLKRVKDLVQAFGLVLKQVPTAQLRIAGETSSESEYVHTIRQGIDTSQLKNHVHFLGSLPETAILNEYAQCNLLVLPSAQESAPMVIAQAMAAGRPVVATRVGGVSEMVDEAGTRGRLVDVGNIKQLAEAMINLLCDQSLQVTIGNNGRAFALEHYHLHMVARQTAQVYRNIISPEQ